MTQEFLIGDTQVRVTGSGPALVFCHGFTTTGQFWREQLLPFAATHRVVVLDLPGHGTAPRPTQRNYTIAAFVADLERVFDALGIEDAVLVGLSMGGTIAQRFALRNLHRLRQLCLVGATPHGLGPDVQVEQVVAAIAQQGVERASQAVIDRSFGASASQELLAFARGQVVQTPAFVALEAIASLNAADSRAELARLGLPTLVVCGTEDRITPPEQSRALADGIPGARLVLIEQAGHFPMLEQPKPFNAALHAFIQSHTA